jgi:hypothetical protein
MIQIVFNFNIEGVFRQMKLFAWFCVVGICRYKKETRFAGVSLGGVPFKGYAWGISSR